MLELKEFGKRGALNGLCLYNVHKRNGLKGQEAMKYYGWNT